MEAPLDDLKGHHNYPSAADFSKEIRATFAEEVPLGMTVGPLSQQQAAELCGCDPTELCPGPLAGIDEGDEVRTIYDGSVGGANAKIQQNTKERTQHPHSWTVSMPSIGSTPPDRLRPAHVPGLAQEPLGLSGQGAWMTQLQPGIGPPRTALPQIDWSSMISAGYFAYPRSRNSPRLSWAHCWRWERPSAGRRLTWQRSTLGFVIHPTIPRVRMAAPKRIKVMELLEELANGSPMSAKAIEKAMGRIQWATACCPLTKSLLQPLWAWKMAAIRPRWSVCWLLS